MADSRDRMLMSAFMALNTVQVYAAVMPDLHAIQTLGSDPAMVRAARAGELFGTAFGIGIGSVVGLLVKSWLPVLTSIATCTLMIGVYESALKAQGVAAGPALEPPVPALEIPSAWYQVIDLSKRSTEVTA
jgi:hypothetical protein